MPGSPWLDRLVGAAAGALVTAVVIGRGGAPEDASTPAGVEAPGVAKEDASAPTPSAPLAIPASVAMPASPPAPSPDVEPEPSPDIVPEPEPEPAPTVRAERDDPPSDALAPVDAEPATGAAPEIPLSRLPGARTLRTSERWDPELSAWVLTHSIRVPAPASQVQTFYVKSLKDAGLDVTEVDEPPTDEWAVRVTVRGRGRDDKVQIAIRQPAGEMRTTARVIWERRG